MPGNLINIKRISPEALQVIKRLNNAKYSAYLVGGCVRDLLLQKTPKDFDVVTDATPEQIKKIFSNSRIIGKRFRLVHCVFRNNIIEVATFRTEDSSSKNADMITSEDGYLLRDNKYGKSLLEDACRRDYTINALYYSPFENVIHDFHGGLYDLLNQNIEIIGDPVQRFQEDPVRIIRAYRFQAKLGFTLSERTQKAIPECFPLLKQINTSRMYEEFNKIFLTGHGATSFDVFLKNNIIEHLLIEHGSLIKESSFSTFINNALINADNRLASGKQNMPHFLYAVMLWPIVKQLYLKMLNIPRFSILKDVTIMDKASDIILQRQCAITNIPQRFISDIKEIWNMQIALENQNNLDNPKEIVWKGIFRASVDFLNARISVEPALKEIAEQWVAQYEFFVPPEMRSRRQIIERDKGNNSKKGGKKDKPAGRSKKKFGSKDGYKNKKFRKSGKVNLKKAQEVLEN